MGKDDRGTGKTTSLIEEAISALAEIPEGHCVFVVGPHTRWVERLSKDFRDAGLLDVIFLTPSSIERGALMGHRGVLLIDDFDDLSHREQNLVLHEQGRLKEYYRG